MEKNIITEYILEQPEIAQAHLIKTYELIEMLIGQKCSKCFSYQMPTYKAKRNVVHFAAFKNHIGIYPGATTIMAFSDQFAGFKFSKGTLQIKYNQELPVELIKQMVIHTYELNK